MGMKVDVKRERDVLLAVRTAVAQHGATREEMIPILADVNRELGYLPSEALDEVSRLLGAPKSQLYSVASFYEMFSTEKLGRHVIRFCDSAPCHVVGGRTMMQALHEALHLEPGETSADGKWTLEPVSCLGICAVGPVMMIDDDLYGNLEPDQLPDILARYV
jgi:NADH:ubiquinone oxidoreductase subunit E